MIFFSKLFARDYFRRVVLLLVYIMLEYAAFTLHAYTLRICPCVHSPVKDTVVTNDRWGAGTTCRHGGYFTCHDRYNPGQLHDMIYVHY